jgi:tricorn protease
MKRILALVVLLGAAGTIQARAESPLLLRTPSVSRTHIVFSYAGCLWIVGREGGDAMRLTAGGHERSPIFSPDGSMIAFTGEYDGNIDVYVVPAAGGVPRRITYHPAPEEAVGWTPDGKDILFRSNSASYSDPEQLYTVSAQGGFPKQIPLPIADEGSYSPDGTKLAYVPLFQWQRAWKRYRGGQTKHIWIVNLADSSIDQKIPQLENSNDFNPMWVADTVYFLSDRAGAVSLFAYNTATHQVTQAVKHDGLDLKSACAGPDAIVYEQFGSLHLYDLKSGTSKAVPVRVSGDLAEVRPHFEKLEAKRILRAGISPGGARAVFEVHGEIVTVPAEKGDIRNLTNSPAIADRDPAWSPDGKSIAYFSDESGEYALHIRAQNGLGEIRKIDLGKPPSYFYSPTWSPDSKKIAYFDKRLNLWYVDLDHPTPVRVDTEIYEEYSFAPAWSPDSRWLAYTKNLRNYLHAVYIYSVSDHTSRQVTDGMSDAQFACFDKNGKYLYFTASTDVGLSAGGGNMSALGHPMTRSVYVIVLARDLPSPLAPESDEEKPPEAAKTQAAKGESASPGNTTEGQDASAKPKQEQPSQKEKKGQPVTVKVDFDRISQRVLALPVPARNYLGLTTGKEGVLFLPEAPPVLSFTDPPTFTLQKFDLKKRKVDKLLEEIRDFYVSFDGEKMLYRKGDQWSIAPTAAAPQAPPPGAEAGEGGPKTLRLADMEVYVDPRAEWQQMYHEVWRIERDFLYDPHAHGLDLQAAEHFYRPYLDGIASRDDLNYLFEEMLGNITLGHVFIGGGEKPDPRHVKGGLLGADYTVENGRYRFARVFDGENWNPNLKAPLTQPGVNVTAGEYLLAVNGKELRATENVYQAFEETAGRQVVLKVGPSPDGKGAREVTVVPVESERGLRNLAWLEGNRRKVEQMSRGRIAYVYLPDTFVDGYTNFNRYYFAQVDKEAAVLDERFNHGGFLADYIIDYLRRPIMNRVMTREGDDVSYPVEAIFGPKVMITNEFAGSGGDAMPWYFRKSNLGMLVGKRTWGGLVGIGGYPELIDGGGVTAPRFAIYGLEGEWEVENHGIAPDVEVELDPKLVREGHDPQLEKAVELVMQQLGEHPLPSYKRPSYPNYHQRFPQAAE